MEMVSKAVIISKDETIDIAIVLKLSEKQLEEVRVSSGLRKFVRSASPYVALPFQS